MKLTKKGEYALRTLIRLGLARRLGRDVVSVSELADGDQPWSRVVIVRHRVNFVDRQTLAIAESAIFGTSKPFRYSPRVSQ